MQKLTQLIVDLETSAFDSEIGAVENNKQPVLRGCHDSIILLKASAVNASTIDVLINGTNHKKIIGAGVREAWDINV